jgi:uncharacterized protein
VAPRVVFDTNVLVSAYAFGGGPAALMGAAITGEFELVTSPALLAELARVLADKLGFDQAHVEGVIRQIARIAVVVRPQTSLSVLADEPDNRVLECAVEGGASVIVSGDRHLLALREYQGSSVLSVAQAVVMFGLAG